jgi:hypothetical protein
VLELAKVTDQTVTPEELAQEPPIPILGGIAPPKGAAVTDPGEGGAEAAAPESEAVSATEAAAPTAEASAPTEAAPDSAA